MTKISIVASTVTLLCTGFAFAGAGAPVPEQPEGGPPSGRPGAILDESTCDQVWKEAKDNAALYVANFQMVDTDKDGTITVEEFKVGCSKGWVQEEPKSKPPMSGGGQTPQEPTEQ